LVVAIHGSQGQAETIGKSDLLGIFFKHGPSWASN
jgi:hypothetical protein